MCSLSRYGVIGDYCQVQWDCSAYCCATEITTKIDWRVCLSKEDESSVELGGSFERERRQSCEMTVQLHLILSYTHFVNTDAADRGPPHQMIGEGYLAQRPMMKKEKRTRREDVGCGTR